MVTETEYQPFKTESIDVSTNTHHSVRHIFSEVEILFNARVPRDFGLKKYMHNMHIVLNWNDKWSEKQSCIGS